MKITTKLLGIGLLAIGLAACGGTMPQRAYVALTPLPAADGVKIQEVSPGTWRIVDSKYRLICYSVGTSINCQKDDTTNE